MTHSMEGNQNKFSIKSWAEEDRPREKLLLKGKSVLSDAELLGILIGSGNKKESAVGLCQKILGSVDNNLAELGRLNVNQLMQFKGIGEAKAISIIAALELGRRRKESVFEKREKITGSQQVFEIFYPVLADLPHEEFRLLSLNRANKVLGKFNISKGGVSATVVDPKIIFKTAIESKAAGLILVHNHPSGNLDPSAADRELTKKLKNLGRELELPILDHVVIGDNAYYSFKDEDLL